MSNFAFLRDDWPRMHEAAVQAEAYARTDARTACFHARRALELAVHWLYANDATLHAPYQENLGALLHEPTFKKLAGAAVFTKAVLVSRLGNQAVHGQRPVTAYDALTGVRELFHVAFWLARTYARDTPPPDTLAFADERLPTAAPAPAPSPDQLRKRAEELAAELAAERTKSAQLDEQLAAVRQEIAAIKRRNAAAPDRHDYSEAETRRSFIDLLLREAGWTFTRPGHDTEYPVTGMPNAGGQGFVDYVLWGDDGKPLGLVEAKRTGRDPRAGQRQAELYADCLERQFGQRPVIFYSNGYEHWLWDSAHYPPRPVDGFFKKVELERMIQRRTARRELATASIDAAIAGRHYQTRAIRRIGEAFERDAERKALVVMATGAGKTRTVIALCDLLMRCNWAQRVLFLADRVALVKQAVNAFKKHMPGASPVNLVTDRDADGRVFVSTYPAMLGLIDETKDGARRFGVGHFDLVIVDEAHRSVYQKYGAIFSYFDALLVGLTATPRDEIDRDTYGLFGLEKGVPTDVYDLPDAISDKFLVPSRAVSVPLKFQRDGIKYAELSEEEKAHWDELEWDDDGGPPPAEVKAEAVNQWLFNRDTVDKVLEHLMTRGQTVAGGRLGKTILFAKNQAHAEFIEQRFNANYPHHKGTFARTITFKTEYAQSLIDDFAQKDKAPHLAISVDMLDTGIDVPEVVNLVFFKLVRSKTKFWQMVGRGTRLCPDLFAPGRDKEFFFIFDYCQNLEFFGQNPATVDGALGEPLGKRLFKRRLELIGELARPVEPAPAVDEDGDAKRRLRGDVAELLRTEVAAMNVDNFIVRRKRRLVEKYREAPVWAELSPAAAAELAHEVAGLPHELDPEDEEAKRFDLLLLNLQLAVLRAEPAFARLRDQVKAIAGALEELATVPMVRAELVLIQELQTEEWWQDATPMMLETIRRKLRSIVRLIEKRRRQPLYTDFEDVLGAESVVGLPGFAATDGFEKFRDKARVFLRAHLGHLSVQKLRLNEPLTPLDLQELERVLVESGAGSAADVARARTEGPGLGGFVRSLVGLDREAAKRALGGFTTGLTLNADQLEFVNLVVDHLTEHGAMPPARLYESPFTDLAPQGPEALFPGPQVDALVTLLEEIQARAEA